MILRLSQCVYISFLILFVVAPIIIIFGFSITDTDWNLTFQNYIRVFSEPSHLIIYQHSIKVAFFTTLMCFIVAYPVSYFIANLPSKHQNTFILLLVIPIWTNFVLRTYAWVKLLGNNGFINNFLGILNIPPVQFLYNEWAIIFGMFYNLLPFMIFPIYNVLAKIDPIYPEAAYDLGASRWKVFYKIIFPMSLTGVKNGILLVFIPSITFFAVADLLGGAKGMLLGNLINQTFFIRRDWHLGSSISVMLIVIIGLVFLCLNIPSWIKKKQEWSFE